MPAEGLKFTHAEVAAYYDSAPAIVAALDRRPDAGAIYRWLYRHHIAPAATAAASGDYAATYALFRDGVLRAAELAAGGSIAAAEE